MSDIVPSEREQIATALSELGKLGLLAYGSFIRTDVMKQVAGPYGDNPKKFPWPFVMNLASELFRQGKILSCAELGGEGWRIIQAVENYHVTSRWYDGIARTYSRIIQVHESMDKNELTSAEQLRDENWVRRVRYEQLLHRRKTEVIKLVTKHKPGLLKRDVDAEVKEVTEHPELSE